MTHIYRTDHRTDGPNRSGPISVLSKTVLGPVLGPDRGPNGPDRTVNIPRHKQWNFDEFIMTAAWKPKKDNKQVRGFMKRMREKYEERIPDPGERFSYVIIKGERCRDDNGRLIPYKVADYMQFPDIAKEFNMEIDINYYLEKTAGMCARFINEDDRYQPPPLHEIMQIKDMDKREKRIDAHSQKKAVNWLKK